MRGAGDQCGIFQEERLRIEDPGLIFASVSFGPLVQRAGLLLCCSDGGLQSPPFRFRVVHHSSGGLDGAGTKFHERSDCDTRRSRDADELAGSGLCGRGRNWGRCYFRDLALTAAGCNKTVSSINACARFGPLRADP